MTRIASSRSHHPPHVRRTLGFSCKGPTFTSASQPKPASPTADGRVCPSSKRPLSAASPCCAAYRASPEHSVRSRGRTPVRSPRRPRAPRSSHSSAPSSTPAEGRPSHVAPTYFAALRRVPMQVRSGPLVPREKATPVSAASGDSFTSNNALPVQPSRKARSAHRKRSGESAAPGPETTLGGEHGRPATEPC